MIFKYGSARFIRLSPTPKWTGNFCKNVKKWYTSSFKSNDFTISTVGLDHLLNWSARQVYEAFCLKQSIQTTCMWKKYVVFVQKLHGLLTKLAGIFFAGNFAEQTSPGSTSAVWLWMHVLFSVELSFLIPAALFNDLALLTVCSETVQKTFEDFRTVQIFSKFDIYTSGQDIYTSGQDCCYWHTVVKFTATEVLCHNVVLCHPVPPPVESVVESTAIRVFIPDHFFIFFAIAE